MSNNARIRRALVESVLETYENIPEESALKNTYSPDFPEKMKAYVDHGIRIANLWLVWKCMLFITIALISLVLFFSLILEQF